MKCNRCGSEHVFLESARSNVGIYCADCGKWIKWATKDEVRVIEHRQMKYTIGGMTSEQKMIEKYKEIEKIVNSPDYYTLGTLDKIAEVVKG
jgi:DNA-directed RNA polymerase subunit RPC12/RpoP